MGFFSSEKTRRAKGPSVELLRRLECQVCPLNKITHNRNPHMAPTGAIQPLIYVLGESPGKIEDIRNEQFVGPSGELLRARLPKHLRSKIRFNNVVRSRPLDNKLDNQHGAIAIEACRPSVERDIAASKPKVIWGFGNVPLHWVSGFKGIMDWRGRRMPVNVAGHDCWYYPMLHPSFLLRTRSQWARDRGPEVIGSEFERAFVFDIKQAIADLEHLPVPEVHNKEVALHGVEIFGGGPNQFKQLRASLEWAKKQSRVGVDYETAGGFRPYASNAKIVTAAVGTHKVSFAFALGHTMQTWSKHEVETIKEMWVDFLKSPVRKISHNLPFEHEWTGFFFGKKMLRASPWEDTLTQACTVDERKGSRKPQGPLSLEFLCKQYFGFSLKGLSNLDKKHLDTEPIDEVLRYNAMDAKYHYLLYMAQRERLCQLGLQGPYWRGRDRVATCVLTQLQGVDIDQAETRRLDKKYHKQIENALAAISKLNCTRIFKKKFRQEFNPESPDDVVMMLRDVLKRSEGLVDPEDKKYGTQSGYSTKKDILDKIKHPVARLIRKVRTARKKSSTYCYTDVWPDGKLHARFNHGPRTVTFRLSSEEPNLQNVPKREEGNKEVRKQIVAK